MSQELEGPFSGMTNCQFLPAVNWTEAANRTHSYIHLAKCFIWHDGSLKNWNLITSDFMAIRENTEGLDNDYASENRAADTMGLLNTTCEGFLAPPQLNPNLIIYKKHQERVRNTRNRERLNATGTHQKRRETPRTEGCVPHAEQAGGGVAH